MFPSIDSKPVSAASNRNLLDKPKKEKKKEFMRRVKEIRELPDGWEVWRASPGNGWRLGQLLRSGSNYLLGKIGSFSSGHYSWNK